MDLETFDRMHLETFERLEQARVEQLIATLDFEYPEDIPEIALMTAWAARIFRTGRAEVVSEWAWEAAYPDAQMTPAVLSQLVRDRWLYSLTRHGWICEHHEDRARAEGRRYEYRKPITSITEKEEGKQ